MALTLRMTGRQYRELHSHVFPADGCEAVATALCGRHLGADHRLLVRRVYLVPYGVCSVRQPDRVTWPTDVLVPLLEEANRFSYSVVKIHGHVDFPKFSKVDDESDVSLFPSVDGWIDADVPHASVVLLRDGGAFGRRVRPDGRFEPLRQIDVVGDDLFSWPLLDSNTTTTAVPEFAIRHAQAFGAGTFERLKRLSVAVVGCSGTGSPLVEQLARLGVGRLVLIDPDKVEEKNLNRIFNATMDDAICNRPKVAVLSEAVQRMGLGTVVVPLERSLIDPVSVREIAACDVVFGCMDSVEGRYVLNKIATYYLLPYIDLGVRIETDWGTGVVNQICGSVHYVQPDGSSLVSRGLVDPEEVRAEGTRRRNPESYEQLVREKYIFGAPDPVGRPAVISLNTLIAAMAANELLARIHSYRDEPNSDYAVQTISLTQSALYAEHEGTADPVFARFVGRGDVVPLLDEVELSEVDR